MAGPLAVVRSKHVQDSVAAVSDQWEVQFARFFGYPPLSSTCPDLAPLPPSFRKRRPQGTWVTSSSSAFLRLVNDTSNSDVILTVCLREMILEEHHVSKLHFSWPQVSCVSGFPIRGIRSVFVRVFFFTSRPLNYFTSSQIQKFALRFSTIYETEIFINALKEILKDVTDIEPLKSDFGSEILSQSEFMSSNQYANRASEESSLMIPAETYTPQMSPSLNNDIDKHPSNHEKQTAFSQDAEGIVAALPPSFTSFLTNCCSEVNRGK
ncbi:hypothetical protein CJ030_MR7G004117 [Morella rubra]|uniref:Poor homologous synapsis 1 PH domain-containing protein n=1 Tax=Morella rubra TaxID=262757 RepID=A0A6A1V5C3_9ROSI|nr:hypothetical protein CJ030_MR7G004117 [Morella rubra]